MLSCLCLCLLVWLTLLSLGSVTVYHSGDLLQAGHPSMILERDFEGFCNTTNSPDSWFMVDFGRERRIIPSHYTLRHDRNPGYFMRNWVFQGKAP